MLSVWISISIASEWPSRGELAGRNEVEDALEAAAIGECTGAGGGMGKMDLSFKVPDESKARAAIEKAMQQHLPGLVYQVNVSEE
jgi:hypothetical protein